MPPAPLTAALALTFLLLTAAQQPPARTRPKAFTRVNARPPVSGRDRIRSGGDGSGGGGGGGSDIGRFFGILTGPQLQLLGPQYFSATSTLAQLAALVGVDTVLPLFEASVGASSGGYDNPAAIGTDESSEEVADLVV